MGRVGPLGTRARRPVTRRFVQLCLVKSETKSMLSSHHCELRSTPTTPVRVTVPVFFHQAGASHWAVSQRRGSAGDANRSAGL